MKNGHKILIGIMLACCWLMAATRVETVKVPKADTLKTVTQDTLVITKTYKDTTILVKSDTVKVAQKPAAAVKAVDTAKVAPKPAVKK